jgi:hypothetical protein
MSFSVHQDQLERSLVEGGLVSAASLARARAIQRASGGTLDTALLEVDAIDEPALALALARAAGLAPAPPAVLAFPDPQMRRIFPGRIAERDRFAPFRLDDREVVVLACWPVDLAALDELAQMRQVRITVHAAPELWVRELQHRVYGTPMPPRLVKLAQTLASRAQSALVAGRAGPSQPPPRPVRGVTRTPPGPVRGAASPALSAAAPGAAQVEAAARAATIYVGRRPAAVADAASPRAQPQAAPASAPPAPRRAQPPAATAPIMEAGGDVAAQALPQRAVPVNWTADAVAALQRASTRDDVVRAAVTAAAQRFAVAAFLAVVKERVFCVDAAGDEGAAARARRFAATLPCAGALAAVAAGGAPHVGALGPEEPLVAALGRAGAGAVLQPVLVGGKIAGVLYVDDGATIEVARARAVVVLAGATGAALERIVRERKRRAPAL